MKGIINGEVEQIRVVWRANARGCSHWFGRVEIGFSKNYFRMGRKIVSLNSIVSVEESGTGFRVTWKATKSGRLKAAAFCCPTVKGHNRRCRDAIMLALNEHLKAFTSRNID